MKRALRTIIDVVLAFFGIAGVVLTIMQIKKSITIEGWILVAMIITALI